MFALHPLVWLSDLSPALLVLAIILLVSAAATDIAARIIPDYVSASIALIGLLLRLGDGHLAASLAVSIGLFAILFLLYMRQLLGGGDVKLLAAVVLLVPPVIAPALIVVISLAGALLALLYILLRRLLPAPGPRPLSRLRRILRIEAFRIRRGGPLPYGVGIAAGAVFVLLKGLT